ncbi:MAG: 4'-phosphopantetheinyl transferase superfamily protein [Lachnospiraceae bacterium]|nr:4'-phosphopantetheinyl transferase superfamily protein [Lachnospiraceae bacterium]
MIIKTTIKGINEYEDSWFEEVFPTLPAWRKEKAEKYKTENGRKLSILAGKLIMDAFIDNNEDPDNVVFNESGKPLVGGDMPFFFSVSHSKEAVALSVSTPNDNASVLPGNNLIDATSVFSAAGIPPRSELKSSKGLSTPSVGVDIECIRDYDEGIAERFFTKEEQDYLKFSENKEEDFTRIWTSKEAYGKFTGGGISDGLKFSIFHNPLIPIDVIFPCCFEYESIMLDGNKYLYTICHGVIEV